MGVEGEVGSPACAPLGVCTHGYPWVQESSSLSVHQVLIVHVGMCVAVCAREGMCVPTRGFLVHRFECETAGLH